MIKIFLENKDIRILALMSFASTFLLVLTFLIQGVTKSPFILFSLLLGIPIISTVIFTFLIYWFGRYSNLIQITKFAAVGATSTLIEIAILNTLFVVTGFDSGLPYSIFKVATFLVAIINAYIFNKYWVFKSFQSDMKIEFSKFFTVNLVGLIINVTTASLVVNVIGPLGSISSALWANIGAMVAVFVTTIWNFLNYKFVVFKAVSNEHKD